MAERSTPEQIAMYKAQLAEVLVGKDIGEKDRKFLQKLAGAIITAEYSTDRSLDEYIKQFRVQARLALAQFEENLAVLEGLLVVREGLQVVALPSERVVLFGAHEGVHPSIEHLLEGSANTKGVVPFEE
jgi:VIT1/CCC1 family predicted Fe2+/Mn2+ transporter